VKSICSEIDLGQRGGEKGIVSARFSEKVIELCKIR
jgi:hypothetical protein